MRASASVAAIGSWASGLYARDRLHAALGLEIEIERAGDVAAEELGERVVGEPDHLGEQLDRQEPRGVAGLEDDLGQRRLGEVLAGLGVDDAELRARRGSSSASSSSVT